MENLICICCRKLLQDVGIEQITTHTVETQYYFVYNGKFIRSGSFTTNKTNESLEYWACSNCGWIIKIDERWINKDEFL